MLAPDKRTVLVIGHPGHELRVFRWLEIMRPTVFVITDGSSHSGRSRLESTASILDRCGARKGCFFPALTDVAAYSAILNRDSEVFARLARDVARHLVDEQIAYVAGDALEGYNPVHDVCRLVIGAAVEMADRCGNHRVGNFEFPLTGPPDDCPETLRAQTIRIELADDAFARKMAAAYAYTELESEVREAVGRNQLEAFRVECLRPVDNHQRWRGPERPYYERYGEQQVAAGHYGDVIRYSEHVLPLADALWEQVDKGI